MLEGLAEGTMRKLRNAAEAGTFRLPERRDETGLRRAVRVAFRRAGIGTRVRRMPCRRDGTPGWFPKSLPLAEREFCAGYVSNILGANIVCVPEAGLKSLKIRR